MIQWAERRHVYDQLVVGDYVRYLSARQEPCDLVLAADVFIYAGDLVASFRPWPGCCVPVVCSPFPWKRPRKPITSCSRIDATRIRLRISIDWPEKPSFTKWPSIPSSSGAKARTTPRA